MVVSDHQCLTREARSIIHVTNLHIVKPNSLQTHNIRLFGAGLNSGSKVLNVVVEYDPQNPQSFITQRHLDALQVKIEPLPQLTTTTFRDRHRVFYIPLGAAKLLWFKNGKPVTTKFYVVNALAPQYATAKIDAVVGGAEDADGVIANLFDDSVPFLPILPAKLSKEEKGKQREKKERKEREVDRDVKEQQAAERQQRDVERQKRQQQHPP